MDISLFNLWNTIEVGEFVTVKEDFFTNREQGTCSKGDIFEVVDIRDVELEIGNNSATNKRFLCKMIGIEDRFNNVSYFHSNKRYYSNASYIGSWFKRENYLLLAVSMLYYIIRG